MIVLTFDLEVENHTFNKRVASPFDPRNYIVQIGYSVNGGKPKEQYYNEWHREPVMPVDILRQMGKGDIICGFNIKFDLLWVWNEPELREALRRGVTIYCGQYAEYLLGGMTQDVQLISMNKTVEQYGGSTKIDAVKEMWENGALTSEIPQDLLTDYLIGDGGEIDGDVMNTYKIMRGQVDRMNSDFPEEFKTMLKFRMDGLLATTEMEYNGMCVDENIGEELRKQIVADLVIAEQELNKFIPELPKELVFNWGSPVHKSALIFGGVVKYQKWTAHTDENGNVLYAKKTEKHPLFGKVTVEPEKCEINANGLYVATIKGNKYEQTTYKSGKQKGFGKFKNVDVPDKTKPKGALKDYYFKFDGYTKPNPKWQGENTDGYGNPCYSTGAKIIEALAKRGIPFTDALTRKTALQKDLGTYYWAIDKKGKKKGMLTLVDEGIIHHSINHVKTVTSRLSSSDPNLQNIPRGDTSDVKKMFVSRYKNGVLAEIDYSQLEVVVQGVLSGDKNLCQDLRDRVDFHCKRLSAKLGEDYKHVVHMCKVIEDPEYKKGRTGAKMFSFQRAYGAGAATIAEDTGMPREEVDALIVAEEALYPDVVAFDRMLEAAINANRRPTRQKLFINGVAFTQGESHWDSPTGTRYVWREHETPAFMHDKGKYTGFSPTERKNYPVQGFGGEIVQTILGLVFRYILANETSWEHKIKLINTVHDCLLLDGENKEALIPVAKEIQAIMESVPEVFNNAYPKLNITVPFPCETEIGSNLYNMTVLH